MTVKEMHIEFRLGLQKIGALSRRKFEQEEIDRFLNKAQDKHVLDSIKEDTDKQGFVRRQIDVERVRTLISTVELYQSELSGTKATYVLPGDYVTIVQDECHLVPRCNNAAGASLVTKYYWPLSFKKTTKSTAPYYGTYRIDVPGGKFGDITNVLNWAGYGSKEDEFVARELITQQLAKNGVPFNVTGNTIRIYGATSGNVVYNIDGTATTIAQIGYQTESITPSISTAVVPSRLVRSNVVNLVLNTPYYKPSEESPISTLIGGTLVVYTHPSMIVNKLTVSHVRKPQRINVILLHDCEIDQLFHQSIVDQAVMLAAGALEQAGLYQVKQSEVHSNQ